MNDPDLAAFLGLNEEEAAIILPRLTPAERAIYERLSVVEAQLAAGIAPKGVIVCRS